MPLNLKLQWGMPFPAHLLIRTAYVFTQPACTTLFVEQGFEFHRRVTIRCDAPYPPVSTRSFICWLICSGLISTGELSSAPRRELSVEQMPAAC